MAGGFSPRRNLVVEHSARSISQASSLGQTASDMVVSFQHWYGRDASVRWHPPRSAAVLGLVEPPF